jgi:3-dehydroquinate synthase
MVLAAGLSVKMGRLSDAAYQRITALLRRLRLPVAAAADPKQVLEALRRDKKREAAVIRFVVLDDIGQASVKEIEIRELERQVGEFPEILRQETRP